MIALVDYGAGNLASVRKAFDYLGAPIAPTRDPAVVRSADRIVVPGVGHFAATAAIGPDLRAAILEAIGRGVPYLGICLGMQWLFDGSEEADTPGLGLIAGRCARLQSSTAADAPLAIKVPHVGWNALDIVRRAPILEGIESGAYAYFTHSYAARVTADTTVSTTHGVPFAAVVQADERVAGVQFHPEKSGDVGIAILRNFCRH